MKTKSRKIICTVTTDLNNDQRMQRICSSLQKAGFDVVLVGRKRDSSQPLLQQRFQQKRLNGFFKNGFLFYAEYNIRLFFFLLFNRFDMVCGVDLDTLTAAYFAAKVKGKVCVYDAHEYFPESPELEHRPKVKSFWQKLESYLLPKVDAVYTVSNGIKAIFEKQYKRKVGLIRNLPRLSHVTKNKEQRYILYQGALNVGRGLETVIKVMPKINAELWLAGEGDLSDELRTLASKTQATIKFLGKIDPTDLKQITANAAVGINLLEPMGKSYYYSLSNKFFDYVMAEIPQVCIGFPEYKKLNQQFEVAVLVDDLEESKLVAVITSLLENETLAAELIENCKQAKLIWNWEKEEEILEKIYNQLAF